MNCRGYTLIEMILVVVIIGILASIAIQSFDRSEDSRRFEETTVEMDELARAIVGDERLITDGTRADFGYAGDVGSLPSNLDDLVINPGAYSTWKGPYIRNDFNENSEDYKRDAWDNPYIYAGGMSISSDADGSPITKQFAGSVDGITSNTVKGIVRDKAGLPPSDSASNVAVTIFYPDGSGSITNRTTTPAKSGEFNFDNQIPIGIHLITAVDMAAGDTASKYIAVNPGSITLTELRMPSELWGSSGGGTSLTMILRPAGNGSMLELTTEGCPEDYQCVDDVASDDDGSRAIRASNSYGTDLFDLENPSAAGGTLDSVIVYAVARKSLAQGDIRLAISTGGLLYVGAEHSLSQSYALYNHAWAINPNSGLAWTWPEISSLEAGAMIRGQNAGKPAYVTQLWVVIAYSI